MTETLPTSPTNGQLAGMGAKTYEWRGGAWVIAGSTPINTVAPTVTGNGSVGSVLTCNPGTWTGDPIYLFQWLLDGQPIPGATGQQYVVTAADDGGTLTCRVVGVGDHGTAVSDGVTVSVPIHYAYEDRPPYVEPNPNATPGSPERLKASELGITSRVSVSTVSAFNTAKTAAVPGRQIYVTANLVGDGTTTLITWSSNKVGGGPAQPAGTNGAPNTTITSGGTDPDGTVANPIMVTCAPGVWIDGGLTPGVENTNNRAFYVRGTAHLWFYGVNIRRANFPLAFSQCPGVEAAPFRVWYCEIKETGHAAVHFGGHHTVTSGRVGESFWADCRYNKIHQTGLAQRRFGEAFYIGYGSGSDPKMSMCHDIRIEANWITDCPSEACDMKAGSYRIQFVDNLITDCDDSTGVGANTTEGFPGSVQFQAHHYVDTSLPAWYVPSIDIMRNRFVRITSASAKFPSGQIVVNYRGCRIIGNYFEDCTVPGSPKPPQIAVYNAIGGVNEGTFGTAGTIQIHNNTSMDTDRAVWAITIGGSGTTGEKAAEQANAEANTWGSGNVALTAVTGAVYVVSPDDFSDDGSGYEGAGALPAVGGALDIAGANTSNMWTVDFAGIAVDAPVNPGARQLW